jgi:hypothetical protein
MAKNEVYEMESLLYEVEYHGYVIIPLGKIYRLLDKGSRAAGTWKALLDVWEEIGHDRHDLHIAELPGENIFLSKVGTEPVRRWAGEVVKRVRLSDSSSLQP